MITSKDCWVKNSCKKYKKSDCECRESDIFCKKLFTLEYLYDQALLVPEQRNPIILTSQEDRADFSAYCTLSQFEKDILTNVKAGKNIYIYSENCGNGKTSWAIKLLQTYLNSVWPYTGVSCDALFIHVPRFLLALKDNISNNNDYASHILTYINTASLIIWDELATKTATPYENEQLLSFISTRLDTHKANIYTSNASLSELSTRLGERLYSRVVNTSTVIEFTEPDKRPTIYTQGVAR